MTPKPIYFASAMEFRKWLAVHHAAEKELLVGFHRKGSGKPSLTWPESVDEALCFGWIDGVRKRVDQTRYTIRFSPRRKTSIWSAINIARVEALKGEGRMAPAGLAAFARRDEKRSAIYSYENRPRELAPEYRRLLKRDKAAWEFFESQPPSYRRLCAFWVMSAKKEETRQKRLARLLEFSSAGKRV